MFAVVVLAVGSNCSCIFFDIDVVVAVVVVVVCCLFFQLLCCLLFFVVVVVVAVLCHGSLKALIWW